MIKELFNTFGWSINHSSNEKYDETINDFIIKKEPREGEKNFYGTLNLNGIRYLQFAIQNRDLIEKNIDYLYEVAKEKFTNNSVINFDGEIIIAVFVNTQEVYGLVIDGQHRLKAIERLYEENILPKNFRINVIVHRITTYNNGLELITRWNREVVIEESKKFNTLLLDELQKLNTSKNPLMGKQRPKIVLNKFIEKVKELNLSSKITVDNFIKNLLKYNKEIKEELNKVVNFEINVKTFCKNYMDGKSISYDRLKKCSENYYCLGLNNSYSYLEKMI